MRPQGSHTYHKADIASQFLVFRTVCICQFSCVCVYLTGDFKLGLVLHDWFDYKQTTKHNLTASSEINAPVITTA